MRSILSKTEVMLLLLAAALLGAAVWGPAVPQPPHYHAFADARGLLGVPNAMDVLSNLAFAVAAAVGAALLWRLPPRSLSNMQRAMSCLFLAGLLLTAFGSAWYHLDPHDGGLAVDRYCMAVAFAGLLGLAAADRVSERAGAALGIASLLLVPMAVWQWSASLNVTPWGVAQFGGMLLIGWMAALRPRVGALRINWFVVLGAYALAKLLEMNDHAVYELTGHTVAGHALKHVVAALAAAPVLAAIARRGLCRQNASGPDRANRQPAESWRNA